MNRVQRKRAALRQGMASDTAVVAIGAHDALTAKMAEHYGFGAVWVSGLAVATMTYAIPDVNLTTMNETLDQAVRFDRATELPVMTDCDNGFGGLNNVVRTLDRSRRRASPPSPSRTTCSPSATACWAPTPSASSCRWPSRPVAWVPPSGPRTATTSCSSRGSSRSSPATAWRTPAPGPTPTWMPGSTPSSSTRGTRP